MQQQLNRKDSERLRKTIAENEHKCAPKKEVARAIKIFKKMSSCRKGR